MNGLKKAAPSEAMKAARLAVLRAMKPYADQIGADGMLAVLSYTVGQQVALLDQRKFTPDQAMQLVSQNIEQGNRDAIEHLRVAPGGHV